MNNYKNRFSNFILILAILIGFLYWIYAKFFNDLYSFINSGFFIALTTLIVGGIAILLYWQGKKDNKRDVAKLVLQEIRYAEQQIRSAKTQGTVFPLAFKILPTNSWYKNIHIFADNLEFPDIDAITRFYSQTEYIDELIKIISDYKNRREHKNIGINKEILDLVEKKYNAEEEKEAIKEIRKDLIKKEIYGQIVSGEIQLEAEEILKLVTSKIEFIYHTTAVDKIKKIARLKNNN